MYFNEKNNTNIDTEFNSKNGLLLGIKNLFSKFKLFIIIGIILLIVICLFFIFFNKKIVNYLILNGEDIITLYQGTDYIEPGYKAYDSNDEDLTNEVKIESNLNTKEVGSYEIIYRLGDIVKVRKITVIEKTANITFIHLTPVNNDKDVYLNVGDEYKEPGYKVFSSSNEDLTGKVIVSGNVDTSKVGSYRLVYTVVDKLGVTTSASRLVIVMDAEISLSLSNLEYTNDKVVINVNVNDEYFNYMILPDGKQITQNIYSYEISENGEYTFKTYNIKGFEKKQTIKVSNIDKVLPTGTCMVNQSEDGYYIKIDASDQSGINKYEYAGKIYRNNIINISTYVENAKVMVYDNANNRKEINCKSGALPVITKITNDGVIVRINSKKVSANISGYYFSYTNKRPNKNGGYIATSKETIDVVRLPGMTYVWVEDSSGKISKPVTIKLGNDVLPQTKNGYTVLKGTKLSDYLSQKGWSIEEFNKLIARSVRAAGLYTKEGAATAAVSLQIVLIQKYGIKIPYLIGGKAQTIGVYGSWGKRYDNSTYDDYEYYGLDCGGFVNWAYHNAGVVYSSMNKDNYFLWPVKDNLAYSKENGEVGDIFRRSAINAHMEHVSIIVGKTNDSFIVAEAYGKINGVVINTYPYNKDNDYTIIKGERLFEKYDKILLDDYPSGF